MIKGVDVSNYQAASGWEDGVDFAFTKITEGTTYVNPKWIAQRQAMRDAGLVVGFYHFARPGSMVAQADFFLDQVALRDGDVIAFDWEDSGVSTPQKDAWISYVQGKTGHRVVLYCNKSFWFGTNDFAGDGLWIATAGAAAGDPGIGSPWLLHQYSTAGGIDHDVAQFDDRADMLAWAGGEDLMTTVDLTTAAIDAVAKKVLTLDNVIGNVVPDDPNTFITLATAVRNIETVVRRTEAAGKLQDAAITALAVKLNSVLSQSQSNGSGISGLKTALAALDLAGLANQAAETLAAKLEHLKFTVTEEA